MTNGGPRHETGKKKIGGPKPAPKAPKASPKQRKMLPNGLAGEKGR
jgi:hypothetical protein